MFRISGTPKWVKHNYICIYGSFWKFWPFPPHFAEKKIRILIRGRRKDLVDDRETTLEMLKSHPLFSACCQGFSPIPWMHTDKTPVSPKYHIWVWVDRKWGFVCWISNWQVPHSHCCFDVKDLLRSSSPTGIKVTGNSCVITHNVWLYFSPFSHISLEMASAWQDQLLLWRKVKAKYFLFFCFISFAPSCSFW